MSWSGATLETRVKCVVSDLDVISKQPSDRLQWDELHLSLIHGTIHHHQQSSFLTNMTVKQSFLTNLWMEFLFLMSSSRATLESNQSRSLIVFYEYLSHHNETIHHHQYSSFLTNMTVRQSFSTKLEIFEVQSFSFWCHHQGQPWRRGSSVSFLILMSYLFDVIIKGNPGVISKQVSDSLLWVSLSP